MSKIVSTATANILAVFAGRTVDHDTVCEQIENEYAAARKHATYGSYVQIYNSLRAAGVSQAWTEPNYGGNILYTFPIPAI